MTLGSHSAKCLTPAAVLIRLLRRRSAGFGAFRLSSKNKFFMELLPPQICSPSTAHTSSTQFQTDMETQTLSPFSLVYICDIYVFIYFIILMLPDIKDPKAWNKMFSPLFKQCCKHQAFFVIEGEFIWIRWLQNYACFENENSSCSQTMKSMKLLILWSSFILRLQADVSSADITFAHLGGCGSDDGGGNQTWEGSRFCPRPWHVDVSLSKKLNPK